ncbi:MAG: hypothetical protein WCI05_10885 [Myxococcales bacterium]
MVPGRFLGLWLSVLTVAGCSAPVVAGTDADAPRETALVVVERTAGYSDRVRGEVVARFLRLPAHADRDQAEELLGASVALPLAGTCAMVSGRSPSAAGTTAAVELRHVGAVVVEVSGAKIPLKVRRLPDLLDSVSGVFYASAADSEPFPAKASYTLSLGDGVSAEVRISAVAPEELTGLRVDGMESLQRVELRVDTGVVLEWNAGGADDWVYVDVTTERAGATFRCAFADSAGRGLVPSSAFAAMDQGRGEDGVRGLMTVHRLRRVPVGAGTFDDGEVRFDFARTVTFTRQ